MSEQTDGQQGAAPATARDCAEWLIGERGTHAVDDAAALIDAYAERVAAARVSLISQAIGALKEKKADASEMCTECLEHNYEGALAHWRGREVAYGGAIEALSAALATLPAAADAQEGGG